MTTTAAPDVTPLRPRQEGGPRPAPVGGLPHNVDLFLRLIPDLVHLDPGQLLLEGLRQGLKLLLVLLRHSLEEVGQGGLLRRRALLRPGQVAYPRCGQLAPALPRTKPRGITTRRGVGPRSR